MQPDFCSSPQPMPQYHPMQIYTLGIKSFNLMDLVAREFFLSTKFSSFHPLFFSSSAVPPLFSHRTDHCKLCQHPVSMVHTGKFNIFFLSDVCSLPPSTLFTQPQQQWSTSATTTTTVTHPLHGRMGLEMTCLEPIDDSQNELGSVVMTKTSPLANDLRWVVWAPIGDFLSFRVLLLLTIRYCLLLKESE